MPAKGQSDVHEAIAGSMDVLRLQLEANQELLLAALRQSEQVDDAQHARQCAEHEVSLLKAGEEELRTTAEFRERLIGIIGHDLRSPLNTILIASGLLLTRGALNDSNAQLVSRIVTSGQRMTRMIGQLLDFTRARLGGGFALELSPVDLGDVCHDIVDELRLISPVALHQTMRGNLCGVWDADRLTQALSNIASNAVDHASPGSTVLVEAYEDGPQVAVAITNSGECIPPELIPIIFTAFRRAESDVGERTGHLGLGLFVACEIARAHSGSLNVRSSNGSTTFTMGLPRAPTP